MYRNLSMRVFFAILFAVLCTARLAAQERLHDTARLERIFFDQALVTADYDAHLATLMSVMQAAPGSVEGALGLRRAMRLDDRCATMHPLYQWLASQAEGGFKDCGVYADDYCQAYVELARKYGPDLLWQETARKWRGVTEWAYIGPFTEGGSTAHDDVFAPEVMLDFDAQYDGAYGPARWQALKHYDPLSARVSLWMQQRWNGGGYYLCTALVSDAAREVLLRVSLNGSGKIWLNGRTVADVDSRSRDWPEITLKTGLQRGRNLLLIKVSGLSAVTASVRSANGGLVEGVLAAVPKAGDSRMAITGGPPAQTMFVPGLSELEHAAIWRGATARSSAIAYLGLAALHESQSMRWQSMEACERAMQLLRDTEPAARLEFLRLLDSSPLHSSSERRRLRREITEALIGEGYVPALIEKAKLLSEDQQYAEAAALLEEARDKHADNWRVTLALADVYRDANWQSEWLRELHRARRQAPKALPVLRALSRHYAGVQELANRVAIEREVLVLAPGDRDAHIALCNTLLRTGESAEALKHARVLAAADPGNSGARETLAETLIACNRLEEALQVSETLAGENPHPEEHLQLAARACLQLGAPQKAEAYYKRVLEESPAQHTARRQLQRMQGESEDFWSAHALSWDEAMKHDVTPEDFPRAGSALVLDEQIQIMYADGSSLSYIHQIRKILTQDGVDQRGKEQVGGDLVVARTVMPDGSVLEPIRQRGGLIEFPGVKIGCHIDIAYVITGDGGPHRTLDGHRFFFSDNSLGEPFCISRWVLISPRSLRMQFVHHNMEDGKQGVSITGKAEADSVIRTWDVRNPRHPEEEVLMPSALEFIPWVECVVPHDWRERARKLADQGLADTRVTDLIRAKAAEVTHAVDGDLPRARAIYDWVNETFATRGDAWNAHQALKAGAGDRSELFVALCTAADIKLAFAYADVAPPYKQAEEENMARPHWVLPRDGDFTTFLVVAYDGDGKPTYIDMSERLRPFGQLSPRLSNAPAILWRDGRYELIHLPGGERGGDRFENRATITLEADGSASVTGSVMVYGERSFGPKEAWRNATQEQMRRQLERELASQFRGLEVKECRFPDLGKVGTPLLREFDGSVRVMGRAVADGINLEMPGEKLFNLLGGLAATERREFDINLPLDFIQRDELRIVPPKGYAFAALPKELLMPTAPLEYSLKFRIDEGALVIERRFTIGPGRITPADYPNFVEQLKQIRQAESARIRLVKVE